MLSFLPERDILAAQLRHLSDKKVERLCSLIEFTTEKKQQQESLVHPYPRRLFSEAGNAFLQKVFSSIKAAETEAIDLSRAARMVRMNPFRVVPIYALMPLTVSRIGEARLLSPAFLSPAALVENARSLALLMEDEVKRRHYLSRAVMNLPSEDFPVSFYDGIAFAQHVMSRSLSDPEIMHAGGRYVLFEQNRLGVLKLLGSDSEPVPSLFVRELALVYDGLALAKRHGKPLPNLVATLEPVEPEACVPIKIVQPFVGAYAIEVGIRHLGHTRMTAREATERFEEWVRQQRALSEEVSPEHLTHVAETLAYHMKTTDDPLRPRQVGSTLLVAGQEPDVQRLKKALAPYRSEALRLMIEGKEVQQERGVDVPESEPDRKAGGEPPPPAGLTQDMADLFGL